MIVAPQHGYEPEPLTQGKRWWGVNMQLYTLRLQDNWGIGDFGDLRQLVEQVARRGGAFIGVNPLHELYPVDPEAASPYSPSSRHWLNIIYINVNRIDDFQQSKEAQAWWRQDDTQRQLAALRAGRLVDYSGVMAQNWPHCGWHTTSSRRAACSIRASAHFVNLWSAVDKACNDKPPLMRCKPGSNVRVRIMAIGSSGQCVITMCMAIR